MSLSLTQIVDAASADNEFSMVMPSDDIYYANLTNERLTDVIATIADAVRGKSDATHTHADKADLVNGTIPASQLPSYVDDVLEYTALANFPTAGETGWMLLWSDYDPGDGANDSDFCTTFIPKYTPSGGTWGGKAFYCDIPMYVGSDATDLSTEKRCIKPVYVHDDCLKGSYQNTSGGRNDVVLRAVYEV